MQFTPNEYQTVIRMLFDNRNFNTSNVMVKCCYGHRDRTPSLSINWTNGMFRCFSCGKRGHLSNLTVDVCGKTMARMLNKNDSDSEFASFVKPIEAFTYVLPTADEIESKVNIDIRGVLVPWRESKEARDYVSKRYIDENVADKLKCFYSEDSYINGFNFTKRFCTPIHNAGGKLINVEGRDTTFNQKRKCIYPFNSIKPLFNWYSLDKSKPVFLFEGLVKMMVAQSDTYFSNSTVSFGSSISDYQMTLLKSIPELILVPDNDKAGITQTKWFKDNYKGKLHVLRLNHPNIKDADEIPEKLGISVKDFREQGGFTFEGGLK